MIELARLIWQAFPDIVAVSSVMAIPLALLFTKIGSDEK